MGRVCAPDPPPKKARVDYSAAVTTTAAAISTTAGDAMTSCTFNLAYLGGIQDKLHLRIKTRLPLKISSFMTPTKTTVAVVTCASDLKKINQVCAYVTGNTENFERMVNLGKLSKDPYLSKSLPPPGDGTLWLSEDTMCKHK